MDSHSTLFEDFCVFNKNVDFLLIVLIILEMLCECVNGINGNNLNVDTSNGIGFVNCVLYDC